MIVDKIGGIDVDVYADDEGWDPRFAKNIDLKKGMYYNMNDSSDEISKSKECSL